ncbi:hypothetical protein Goshw_025479 [Gossypium schwendimanii]|uniref:Uncharacterized protein n=1 Tax=Gossypium schwendimanii TaxID=34291 RepID=A0A7J9MJZ9_GOSSC|nr:hypothetical protein [Gossypium schwendimanii]
MPYSFCHPSIQSASKKIFQRKPTS